ncbi:MAG: 50S ribosomal protein L1 [Candidatus Woesearchaeota archaeon]
MDKKEAIELIRQSRAQSEKRKFTQSVDVIINLQDLDFKKPEHQIDFFVTFPHTLGKKKSVAAFVDADMVDEAKKNCDQVISLMQFEEFGKDKKKIKKLAKQHDFFIAQATIMTKIAATFGRVLGPKNKMPNPKAGAVVAPRSNLKPLYDKLQKTVRILARNKPVVQVMIGIETMTDEELADNLYLLYDQMVHHLPKEKNNIKNIYVKTTMGKAVRMGA